MFISHIMSVILCSGKQKRGRTGPREGKRIKQVTDHGQEEEDDMDGMMRS